MEDVMKSNMSIEKLSNMALDNLLCTLEKDDGRWLEIMYHNRTKYPDFDAWLVTNGLERTPENVIAYLIHKYDEEFGEADRKKAFELYRRMEQEVHKSGFYLLLEKRLEQYRDTPYEGRLVIGHFVGIKKNIHDNPYEYKRHDIGQIIDYLEEPDGYISVYILSRDDDTEIRIPACMTYRIY